MSDQPSTPIKESQARGPGYLEVIFIGLLLTSLALITYDRMFAQKVKVVDLQEYLRTQKALLAAGEITKSQWQANLDSFDEALNQEAEAHPNHLIILNDVVLRNGNEISLTAQKWKNESSISGFEQSGESSGHCCIGSTSGWLLVACTDQHLDQPFFASQNLFSQQKQDWY